MGENIKDNLDENLEQVHNDSLENEEQESLSPEELLKAEVNTLNDKYTRLFAEFDNYKKRTSKERVDLIQSAGKDVIYRLLPILDDFDRALQAIEQSEDNVSVKEGVQLIYNKLHKTLEQQGLKEMNVQGESFDPEFQEAITTIPAPNSDLQNKVVDVIEKGYFLNDKVLRFAKVVIGK